jgi:hypothetical protein
MLHRNERLDEGTTQKLNFWMEAQQFHHQFQRYLKMTDVGRNM